MGMACMCRGGPKGALAGGSLGVARGRVLLSVRSGCGGSAGVALRVLQQGCQLCDALVRAPQYRLFYLQTATPVGQQRGEGFDPEDSLEGRAVTNGFACACVGSRNCHKSSCKEFVLL